MHGLGNDYIYVNAFEETIADPPALARKLSDRHFGIGGDGLVLIAPSSVADFQMIMFNADGSQGEMCGNGSRCVAKYVYDRGMTDKTVVTLETLGAPEKSPLETELMGYVVVNGKEGGDRKRVRGDATSDSKWLTSVYPRRRYPCYGIKTGERRKDWYYVFVEEDSVWGYVLGGFVTFEK